MTYEEFVARLNVEELHETIKKKADLECNNLVKRLAYHTAAIIMEEVITDMFFRSEL